VENALETTLEQRDKLDADRTPVADAAAVGVVNGPEDETLDWLAVDWPVVEDEYGVYDRGSSRRRRQGIWSRSATCRS